MFKEFFNIWNIFIPKCYSLINYNDIQNKLIYNKKSVFEILGYIYILQLSYKFIFYSSRNLKKLMWNNIKKIPLVNTKINDKVKEIIDNINLGFQNELTDLKFYKEIPIQGLKNNEIENQFKQMVLKKSNDYTKGKVSGATYSNNKDLDKLMALLFIYFNKSNPLHTNLYPSIRKMENELISFMINLFNGNEDTCGVFTGGGTESILMACKTYRELGKSKGILKPEIIVSDTVHCAFNKACQYFNIKLVSIPCLKDGSFNLKLLEKFINNNTILIVGSIPSYSLGIIDPVPKLNDIAIKYNIPLHLDACIGSFLINFSGLNYDFTYPGVTSISADFHKYGHTPKGSSSILYKNKEIMKYQYFIDSKWSGGIYATTSMAGSRCGNIVALSWATLMYYGKIGYMENYEKIIEMNKFLVEKINDIDELFIYGEPKLSIIGVGSEKINISMLGDLLKKEGWDINMIQNPDGFHFCITSYHNLEVLEKFINDMKNIIENNELKKGSYSPCIYGTMKKINDIDIIDTVLENYLHSVNGIRKF